MTTKNKPKRRSKLERLRMADQSRANILYSFDMEFGIEEANKRIDALNVPAGEYIPAYQVIDVYEQQDAIIALKLMLLNDPELWEVGIDSYFYNLADDKMLTIPFSASLPNMSYAQMLNGTAAKVEHHGDFKRIASEWRGLQKEMIANWEDHKIPDGYELIKSMCRVHCEAKFKDAQAHREFNECLRHRDNGTLISQLKKNWLMGGN